MPMAAATSPSGLSEAACAICRSGGKGIGSLQVVRVGSASGRHTQAVAVVHLETAVTDVDRPGGGGCERAEGEEVDPPQQAGRIGGDCGRDADEGGVGVVDVGGGELEPAAGLVPED